MRFAYTNIISTNWKLLVDFYVKTFECKVVPPIRKQSGSWLDKATGLKNAKLEGAHLLLPGYGENGPTLEIYQYGNIESQNPVSPNKRGFGHIAFEVESVELVLETLEKYGGRSSGEITKRIIDGVGEITFVYARDPEGNLIELQSWK
ncbi:VOC family protein [Flagellimonas sp. CMM7]|uniref:VOC family protein n=1 Tax=Flagellimonas sp. CMM7 TaxID=2654676 RepID=UPI001969C000|nr:VOC family protein [Flagellimonas sp. CMM7]UII81057.1 VOC family protein [Flagellimonas sp. CMM7]